MAEGKGSETSLSVKTDDVLTASMVARMYATMDWSVPENGLQPAAPRTP